MKSTRVSGQITAYPEGIHELSQQPSALDTEVVGERDNLVWGPADVKDADILKRVKEFNAGRRWNRPGKIPVDPLLLSNGA